MTRLLIKISLLMLGSSALIIFIAHAIFINAAKEKFDKTPPSFMVINFELTKDKFNNLPDEKIPDELIKMSKICDCEPSIVDINNSKIPDEVRTKFQSAEHLGLVREYQGEPKVFIPLKNSMVFVAEKMPDFKPIDSFYMAIVLAISILLIALAGLWISTMIVTRLRKIEKAAMRISKGDLTARAGLSSKDAIGSLATHFDIMAEKNQNLIENQKRLMQAVSHELRTPTSRIRFGLEMLADSKDESYKQKRIASIDEDLAELDDLVEELLIFNRFDVDKPPMEFQPVNIKDAIERQARRAASIRPDIVIEIDSSLEADFELICDERAFNRALQNLIANAVRYAEKKVEVQCRKDGDGLLLKIIDDGPGIPISKRKLIMEPFARLDDSRNRDSGGVGLGLSIVQRIVLAHKGSLEIDDAQGGGTCITTVWPGVT